MTGGHPLPPVSPGLAPTRLPISSGVLPLSLDLAVPVPPPKEGGLMYCETSPMFSSKAFINS